MHDEFLSAFDDADLLWVTDIYPAGEAPIPGVHARMLAEGIAQRSGRDVRYVGDRTRLLEQVLQTVRPGDLVLTLGAGDVGAVADQVLQGLSEASGGAPGQGGEGERHAR